MATSTGNGSLLATTLSFGSSDKASATYYQQRAVVTHFKTTLFAHALSSVLPLKPPCFAARSLTPTFAAVSMFINNARWDGVPFLLKAGKALHKRTAEIRVQFRHSPGNLYRTKLGSDLDAASNELVIRIQPKESIYLKINNKVRQLQLLVP